MEKICKECKLEKEKSEFYKDNRRNDGLYTYCKECQISIYKEKRQKISKKWRKKNPDYMGKWQKENRISVNKYMRERKKNPKFHIDSVIAKAIWEALKKEKRGRRWEKLVGYTLQDLMNHLKSKFTSKMNWKNYGSYWEIDHKIPKSLFNYDNAESLEFKKCWGLDNLQPLPKVVNRKKYNKIM